MVVRVTEGDRPAFQLRPGEEGISVFQPGLVDPSLTETEVLDAFRPGSRLVTRSIAEVEAKGLSVVPTLGVPPLPERLQYAHAEIRAGASMTRKEFKQALKELE